MIHGEPCLPGSMSAVVRRVSSSCETHLTCSCHDGAQIGMYSKSVEELDLGTMTALPYPFVIAAGVKSIKPHPAADQPGWRIVQVREADAGAAPLPPCVRAPAPPRLATLLLRTHSLLCGAAGLRRRQDGRGCLWRHRLQGGRPRRLPARRRRVAGCVLFSFCVHGGVWNALVPAPSSFSVWFMHRLPASTTGKKVEPVDKKGVLAHGIMLAERELGVSRLLCSRQRSSS